jgi:hypothetical protein
MASTDPRGLAKGTKVVGIFDVKKKSYAQMYYLLYNVPMNMPYVLLNLTV